MGEEANCNVAMESAAPKENGHTTGGAAAEAKAAAAWAEIAVTDAAAVPKPTPPPAAVAVDPRLQGISDAIRVVPHFPKQGPTLPSRFASLPHVQIPSGIWISARAACMQASCSTTSRRCCCARGCSRTPSTSSSSATAAWPSPPSPVNTFCSVLLFIVIWLLFLSRGAGEVGSQGRRGGVLRFRNIFARDLPWSSPGPFAPPCLVVARTHVASRCTFPRNYHPRRRCFPRENNTSSRR